MDNKIIQRITMVLIGLVFLSAGLLKLFSSTPSGVGGYFLSLGIPAALFFAWVVLLSEIIFGLCVLGGFKLKYTVWPLVLIMLVAGFVANWGAWNVLFMHLVIAANLVGLAISEIKNK